MTDTTPRLHGKAQLDPTDYEFVRSGDNDAAFQMAQNPPVGIMHPEAMKVWAAEVAAVRAAIEALAQSVKPNSLHKCTHCGASIRYFNIFRHVPTGERIVVGDQCAEERMQQDSRAALEQSLVRKAEAARAAEMKLRAEAHAWIAANEALWAQMLANRGDQFVADMVKAVAKYGSLTEKQAAALPRVFDRLAEWTTPGAVCELREIVEAPTGKRITVEGVVAKTDSRENGYGVRYVMTVKADEGWFAWGTIPEALFATGESMDSLVGKRVRFIANLEAGNKPNIVFTNRPTKAELVEAVCA